MNSGAWISRQWNAWISSIAKIQEGRVGLLPPQQFTPYTNWHLKGSISDKTFCTSPKPHHQSGGGKETPDRLNLQMSLQMNRDELSRQEESREIGVDAAIICCTDHVQRQEHRRLLASLRMWCGLHGHLVFLSLLLCQGQILRVFRKGVWFWSAKWQRGK